MYFRVCVQPPLRKLQEKAQASYFKGLQPLRPDIFTPRSAEGEPDELSIFSGRTARTVATKSNRPQRAPPSVPSTTTTSETSSPATSHSGASDPNARNSQSPAAEVFPGLDSSYRTAVHPGLVEELRQFEGQINHASAYYQPPAPPVQQEQQYVYTDQQSYQQQPHQEPQQQMWYQNNAPSEHHQHQHHDQHQHQHQQHQHQHYSTSPPTTHGSQEQPHQYAYAATPAQPPISREEHHPQEYAYQQQEAVGTNPHSVPIYGGAYSPPQGADTAQYQNNAYTQAAATVPSSSTSSPYSAYATHSVPDHRSELWAVNVGVASPESEMSSTSTPYVATPVYESGGAEQGHPRHQGQPMYHQYHPGVQPPQPLQPQHTGQGIQPQYTGGQMMHSQQPLQPQHTGQSQMVQPQHTGQAMQVQHTEHMHHTQQVQYTQDPQYAYAAAQQHQQQMMQPPPPPSYPPSAPYHVQPGAPYTLTETWTSFIQHELPGPPGGGPVRR